MLCGVLGLLAPVHRCARSVSCALGCVCGLSLRGAHLFIRTAAIRSRQELGALRARTRPSERRLFVACRGWVPSGRTRVRADGICSVAGRGWVRCRVRKRPFGRQPVLLGTCPCALVVAGGVPLWPASWPRVVRRASSGPVALGAPVGFPEAVVPFFTPGTCAPALVGGCAGHAEAGRELGSLCLLLAPVGAEALGLSLADPSGVGLELRALRWLACVDPVTEASGFPYHPSFDGGLGRCTGAVSCGRRHLPLRVGGRNARVPCVCACARPSWPGWPPGRVPVRLTFSSGRFVFLLCSAPSGLELPLSWSCVPPLPFVSPLCCCFLRAPFVSCFLRFLAPGALGLGAVCCLFYWPRASRLSVRSRRFWVARLAVGSSLVVALPPPCVPRFSLPPLGALCLFFFLFLSTPQLSLAFSGFRPRVP